MAGLPEQDKPEVDVSASEEEVEEEEGRRETPGVDTTSIVPPSQRDPTGRIGRPTATRFTPTLRPSGTINNSGNNSRSNSRSPGGATGGVEGVVQFLAERQNTQDQLLADLTREIGRLRLQQAEREDVVPELNHGRQTLASVLLPSEDVRPREGGRRRRSVPSVSPPSTSNAGSANNSGAPTEAGNKSESGASATPSGNGAEESAKEEGAAGGNGPGGEGGSATAVEDDGSDDRGGGKCCETLLE